MATVTLRVSRMRVRVIMKGGGDRCRTASTGLGAGLGVTNCKPHADPSTCAHHPCRPQLPVCATLADLSRRGPALKTLPRVWSTLADPRPCSLTHTNRLSAACQHFFCCTFFPYSFATPVSLSPRHLRLCSVDPELFLW